MKIYLKEIPDERYPIAGFKGLKNYRLGIASPSLTAVYSFKGIPENAKYSKRHKCYVINDESEETE